MTTRRQHLQRIARAVEPIYGATEAALIARILLAEKSGVSEAALIADPEAPLQIEGLDPLIEELIQGRPIQYVLGHTEFDGLDFCVREGCLIPRPETEELVVHIARQCRSARRILDIGCGSGCIALALKHRLPAADVMGIDISEEALEIARENSERLHIEAAFRHADALNLENAGLEGGFDLLVSNPPYIPRSEYSAMRINVTRYEPHAALFVPDQDPLCFYRAIAHAARTLLREEGSLWFEIHETQAEAMLRLLREAGFARTELLEDLNGKPRMTWSRR